MKKVIVACGSGVATSQTVASKINKLFVKNDINHIKIEVVDLRSLELHLKSSDAYVAITKVDQDINIPVINGIAFLTGVGVEKEFEKLINACK